MESEMIIEVPFDCPEVLQDMKEEILSTSSKTVDDMNVN